MIRLRYAASVAALGLTLAGCGSGNGGANAATSPSAADAQDANVKFAECMRQHGVDMQDPKPGDNRIRITAKKMDQAKLNAAMQACRKYSPKGNVDPNDPEARDHLLKVAQCLRQHGVDVQDPQPGQGLRIQARGDQANRAKTQQAMDTCDRLVPPPGSPTPGSNGG